VMPPDILCPVESTGYVFGVCVMRPAKAELDTANQSGIITVPY